MRASAVVPAVVSLLVFGLIAVPPVAADEHAPSEPGDVPVEAGVDPDAGVPDPRPGEAFADPEVAQLQQTATEVQEELDRLTARIGQAQDQLDEADEELDQAKEQRETAEEELGRMQGEVDDFSKAVFTGMGRPNDMQVFLAADSAEDVLARSSMIEVVRGEQEAMMTDSLRRHRAAVDAERRAQEKAEQARQRQDELVRRTSEASNRADAISSELRGPIDQANAAVVAQQEAQQERNESTEANWDAYLSELADAGVSQPSADELSDPTSFPAGLRTVEGEDGEPQAGVAQVSTDGERVLVLPEETTEAVTQAVDALGKPYVPRDEGTGPIAYSCDGLVHTVFSESGLELPESAPAQMAEGEPVPYADAQPGDLVFVGPERYGVQHVGIVLDDRTMLAADGRLAGVAVTDLPTSDTALEIVRPALGRQDAREVPEREEGELTWRCGGVESDISAAGDGDETQDSSDAAHGGGAGAWGGYPNGLIPSSALCSIGTGSHALRCDAAQAFQAMSQAYEEEFGEELCVTDSYRTFDAQVDLYHSKPGLAAVPGTSNHGWGLALDMCSGIESFGTPEFRWMQENAPSFGWIHPHWARQGGGREEPWHWEYAGRS